MFYLTKGYMNVSNDKELHKFVGWFIDNNKNVKHFFLMCTNIKPIIYLGSKHNKKNHWAYIYIYVIKFYWETH